MSVRKVAVAVVAAAMMMSGCKKKPVSSLPVVAADAVIEQLRDRPVPDPARARFSIKMTSDKLNIHAPRLGGGLVVERPDKAYIAVLDPMGSPVITLTTDGQQVVFLNNRDRQYVVQDDLADALGGATKGSLQLSDAVGILLGLLPIADSLITTRQSTPDGLHLVMEGPTGLVIDAMVDAATATPRSVVVLNAKGDRSIEATYEPYELSEEGYLLPTEIALYVPSVDLHLNLRFKQWNPLDEAPDVFSPKAPEKFEVIPFDVFVKNMAQAVDDGSGDDSAPSAE